MERIVNTVFYKDGKDLIVVFKNADTNTENIINSIFSSLNIDTNTVSHLEETVPPEEGVPEIPAFLKDTTPPSNVEDYKITHIKKYAGSNKTLAEIYEIDAQWLTWIMKNYKARTPEAQKDFDAIKDFLSTK